MTDLKVLPRVILCEWVDENTCLILMERSLSISVARGKNYEPLEVARELDTAVKGVMFSVRGDIKGHLVFTLQGDDDYEYRFNR